MKEDLRNLLKQHHVYITTARLAMLEIFLQTNEALTYNHFLTQASLRVDRITIFRTLKLFVNKKIIHRIPAPDGIKRYLLQQTSSDVHSNFICSGCKKVTPLKTIVRPKIKLPKGFTQQNIEIMIGGLCNSCKF
jgi:Fur family ferric uptake transcriptional regulator